MNIQFYDGDTVCFFGDSITHGGKYVRKIIDFYVLNFPERKINFINCGICGDSVGTALTRLERSVLKHKPNKMVMMFGMNDIGRHLYSDGSPAPDDIALQRRNAIEAYEKNVLTLIDRLHGIDCIYCTPTPFDELPEIEAVNNIGCNDALRQCRDIILKYAKNVVDFYTPLNEINQRRIIKTIISEDRVHPGEIGHGIMADLFLKWQGFEAQKYPMWGAITDEEVAFLKKLGIEKDEREEIPYSQERYDNELKARDLEFIEETEFYYKGKDFSKADERDKTIEAAKTREDNEWVISMLDNYAQNYTHKQEYLEKTADALEKMYKYMQK